MRKQVEKMIPDELNLNEYLGILDDLANDIERYDDKISEVLLEIQALSPQTAMEAWHGLIEDNYDFILTDPSEFGPGTFLTSGLYTDLATSRDFIKSEAFFLKDPYLLHAAFRDCPVLFGFSMNTIDSLIKQERFQEADELFQLVLQNKRALQDTSVYYLLDTEFNSLLIDKRVYSFKDIYRDSRTYPEEAISMFRRWIEHVEEEEDRLKLKADILRFQAD